MRCINCNYDNLDGLQYCVNCGSQLMTREDKQKKEMEGQNKLNKLYLLIGILAFVLVVLIVLLLLGVGFGEEKASSGEVSTQVESATVGTWNCNTNAKAKEYTITIELNSDGTYRFGAYKYLDTNHVEGTFTSNSFGTKDSTGKYNLYNMSMTQKKIVDSGKITEGEASSINYSIGITDDLKEAMFTNGSTNVTYYCKK